MFQTCFFFFSNGVYLFSASRLNHFDPPPPSPPPKKKITKLDKSAAPWPCLRPCHMLLKALPLVLAAAKILSPLFTPLPSAVQAELASSLWRCSASVATVVIPKCCTQVYTEPPSSLDWHKWWKRGKQREEGKLGSAMKHLRCSTRVV